MFGRIMNNLIAELRRRNVIRVAGVYVVASWVLAQVANTLEESLGLPDWFDGVVVAFLLLGFPIAIILAWAFELTPDGVVREEDAADPTGKPARKLDYIIVAAIIGLVAALAWQQLRSPDPAPAHIAAEQTADESTPSALSIAVLPFADLSPDGDQEYFSDGVSEEILNVLVKIPALDVVSRTSSFQFKGKGLGIPEIAAELKVRHVLEGSVRKAGDNIRVTAQLIDAQNDLHLWSETYDRPLTAENVFVIQDDISTSIVNALRDKFNISGNVAATHKPLTDDLDAYGLYLRARNLVRGRRDLDIADTLLRQALDIDPKFADALALLAAVQTLAVGYGYSDVEPSVAQEAGIELAEQALALDPDSAAAIAILGHTMASRLQTPTPEGDIEKVYDYLKRAVELSPHDSNALNWLGLAFSIAGYLDDAAATFAECVRVEPYHTACNENLFSTLAAQERDDEAMQALQTAYRRGAAKGYFVDLALLARQGEELAFLLATNTEQTLMGWHQQKELYDAFRNLDSDHSELAESLLEFLNERTSSGAALDRLVFSSLLVPLGEHYAFQNSSFQMWSPSFRRFRQTANFKTFIRDATILAYWQKHGFPPKCEAVGEDDFRCD